MSIDVPGDAQSHARDTERIQILGELRGEVMVFEPMAIKEISRGGVQVETAIPLQLNSLHQFRLTLGERSIVLKGRVAHCSISEVEHELVIYKSGLEFVEPSLEAYTVITEFIEAIKDGRQAVSTLPQLPRRGTPDLIS